MKYALQAKKPREYTPLRQSLFFNSIFTSYPAYFVHSKLHSLIYKTTFFLQTGGKPKKVYCDMDDGPGGWTVIQRRQPSCLPADLFYKNWSEYKEGFGDLRSEFWLGLDAIHSLTDWWQHNCLHSEGLFSGRRGQHVRTLWILPKSQGTGRRCTHPILPTRIKSSAPQTETMILCMLPFKFLWILPENILLHHAGMTATVRASTRAAGGSGNAPAWTPTDRTCTARTRWRGWGSSTGTFAGHTTRSSSLR